METHIIDGKEYFATKIVTFKGKEYQELKSTDVMRPSTRYAERINGKLKSITCWDIEYALRVKYAMCVLAMHGTSIMDYTLTLNEYEFDIQNGKLVILNEEERAIFNKYTKQDKQL